MELQDAINQRNSVRAFEEKKVPRKILKELIKSATKAPSASNKQPWIFYIVENKKKRDEISKLLNKIFQSQFIQKKVRPQKIQKVAEEFYADMGKAQNIIFASRKKIKNETIPAIQRDIKGISSAIQNLTLSAVEKGLGTCWLGTFDGNTDEKKIKKILKTPKDEDIVACLLIGYPKKGFKPLKRTKKKLNEILKFV